MINPKTLRVRGAIAFLTGTVCAMIVLILMYGGVLYQDVNIGNIVRINLMMPGGNSNVIPHYANPFFFLSDSLGTGIVLTIMVIGIDSLAVYRRNYPRNGYVHYSQLDYEDLKSATYLIDKKFGQLIARAEGTYYFTQVVSVCRDRVSKVVRQVDSGQVQPDQFDHEELRSNIYSISGQEALYVGQKKNAIYFTQVVGIVRDEIQTRVQRTD